MAFRGIGYAVFFRLVSRAGDSGRARGRPLKAA
jgi:hypothetical protein